MVEFEQALHRQLLVDEIIGFGSKDTECWEYCIWASGLSFSEFYDKWVWGLSSEGLLSPLVTEKDLNTTTTTI
jgi:hypothetical protein